MRQEQAGNAERSISVLLLSVGITLEFHDTSIFKNEGSGDQTQVLLLAIKHLTNQAISPVPT